jgi:formate hydrogenlyase subunit 3/multisubunit Na+/H+ antiporter MnhD subunit
LKEEQRDAKKTVFADFSKTLPIILFFFALFYAGLFVSNLVKGFSLFYFLPILVATILFALDWLNTKIKGFFSLLIIAAFSYYLIPGLTGINKLFSYMFLIAGFVQIIGTMNAKGTRQGFYPFLVLMLLSLGNLLIAETTLQFFFTWELMAVSSYFLILRGKKAEKSALSYFIFSSAGAYLILLAFGYAFAETNNLFIYSLAGILHSTPLIFTLLAIGFLIKSGALGLHVWLPGTYAESDDDVSPFISSILSKAGIFGLILFLLFSVNNIFLKLAYPTFSAGQEF